MPTSRPREYAFGVSHSKATLGGGAHPDRFGRIEVRLTGLRHVTESGSFSTAGFVLDWTRNSGAKLTLFANAEAGFGDSRFFRTVVRQRESELLPVRGA
jgi:hypothetical protein